MKTAKSDRAVTVFFLVAYVLLFLVTASFLPEASFDGKTGSLKIVPDLLFSLAIIHGLLDDNRRRAGIMALVAGFLTDVFLMPPSHLSPLLFTLGAYFAPSIYRFFTRNTVLAAVVSSLPFFAARLVCGAVFLLSEHKELTIGKALAKTLLPEFGLNVLSLLIGYLVFHFLFTRFRRKFC